MTRVFATAWSAESGSATTKHQPPKQKQQENNMSDDLEFDRHNNRQLFEQASDGAGGYAAPSMEDCRAIDVAYQRWVERNGGTPRSRARKPFNFGRRRDVDKSTKASDNCGGDNTHAA
jgi:hypothetical protein